MTGVGLGKASGTARTSSTFINICGGKGNPEAAGPGCPVDRQQIEPEGFRDPEHRPESASGCDR